MEAQSQDTDLRAESVQLALLREAAVARRLATAFSLSRTVIGLARAAIRRRCPDLDERQVLLRFVELHYGAELAEKLRNDLARRMPADRGPEERARTVAARAAPAEHRLFRMPAHRACRHARPPLAVQDGRRIPGGLRNGGAPVRAWRR